MSEGRNNIASTSLLHFVFQSELEVHVESDSSKLRTSTSLQRITSLVPEVLDNVIFQTLSVSEGRGVRKSAKGEQNLTLLWGGDEKVIRTPPAISFSPVNRKLTCSLLPMSLSVLNTPCVDGRILVAFLYVASRRHYLGHFIAASRTQF